MVFNVGDSRVYAWDGRTLEQLSVDHSAVQELVDAGLIRADEAERHPERNVITRAIGADDVRRPRHLADPRGRPPGLPGLLRRALQGGRRPAHRAHPRGRHRARRGPRRRAGRGGARARRPRQRDGGRRGVASSVPTATTTRRRAIARRARAPRPRRRGRAPGEAKMATYRPDPEGAMVRGGPRRSDPPRSGGCVRTSLGALWPALADGDPHAAGARPAHRAGRRRDAVVRPRRARSRCGQCARRRARSDHRARRGCRGRTAPACRPGSSASSTGEGGVVVPVEAPRVPPVATGRRPGVAARSSRRSCRRARSHRAASNRVAPEPAAARRARCRPGAPATRRACRRVARSARRSAGARAPTAPDGGASSARP